jgi:hypothetical protein
VQFHVGLLAANSAERQCLADLFVGCGLSVWLPAITRPMTGDMELRSALCLVVAMPGQTSLDVLEGLRTAGMSMPALLLVDDREALSAEHHDNTDARHVLSRPANQRDVFSWLVHICADDIALRADELSMPPEHGAASHA